MTTFTFFGNKDCRMEYYHYRSRPIVCGLQVFTAEGEPYETLTAVPEEIPREMIENLKDEDRLFFVRDYDQVGYVAWLKKYLKATVIGEVSAGYAKLTAIIVSREQLLKKELV